MTSASPHIEPDEPASGDDGVTLEDISMEPIRRNPLYFQVRERIERLVDELGLKPGSRLPSEREFAEQLSVSRQSIRQALASLESQGYVEIRHGSGAYLKATPPSPSLSAALTDTLVGQNQNLPHVMEARSALEPNAAYLAAQRRTDADVAAMEAALSNMEEEVDAGGIGQSGDREFHRAIWTAARSPVIENFLDRLGDGIARVRDESLSQTGRPRESLAAHWRILEAIRSADPPGARNAMEQHMLTVRNSLLVSELERSEHPG
ncbi:MAG: FadR/GntR family transcriptional regulator [Acidimicrobiales bacterium]